MLVASEVALGVVLLVGAGLLIRTFAHLQGLNPGLRRAPRDHRAALAAGCALLDREHVNRLFDQSLARIRELPGVESAAVVLSLPYERALNSRFRRLDGRHVDTESQITNMFYVTPDYFLRAAHSIAARAAYSRRQHQPPRRLPSSATPS